MKIVTAVAQVLTVAVLMALVGVAAAQQAYPNKPIRMIVPYTPGGSPEVVARLFGQKLTERSGQQVILDNRPGGNGIIAGEALIKSPPDGYTIMMIANTHVIVPLLQTTPFDIIKDFAPVATLTDSPFVIVLNPSVPANNLRELIALAKSKPGQINFASSGTGSLTHLLPELLNILGGIKMQHIPYKGPGPAVADLIGGQVQLSIFAPATVLPHIQSGKLKPIAIGGSTRFPSLPLVPTFAEAGVPSLDMRFWYGFLAPVSTSKEVVNKLSIEIAEIMAIPDLKKKLSEQGLAPYISTPDEFAALLKSDMANYAKIIKTANIKLEN